MQITASKDDLVHHYTDAAGVLGIVQRNKMWCTDIRYLNDAQEFVFAQGLYAEALDPEFGLDPTVLDVASNAIDMLHKPLETEGLPLSMTQSFVASFSVHDDDLSQWRGYSGTAARFSIGFKRRELERHLAAKKFEFGPVVYSAGEAKRRLAADFNRVAAPFREKHLDQSNPMKWTEARHIYKPFVGSLNVEVLLRAAPFCKDPSFEKEGEWRIVYQRGTSVDPDSFPLSFRVGRSLIIPYIELDIPMSVIAQIRVGPGPRLVESLDSLRQLVPNVRVEPSSIPYRDW